MLPGDAEESVLVVVGELVWDNLVRPAALVEPQVVREGLVFATYRLEVVEDCICAVVDLASELTDSQAEIDVLEAVDERLVEAADTMKRLLSYESTPPGDDLELPGSSHRRMVTRESSVEVPRIPIEAYDDTGVLDRVVRIEHPRTDHGGVRMAVRISDERIEPTRLRDRVVVQEDQVLTGCGGGPSVACLREAPVLPSANHANAIGVRGQCALCFIG